ncbi:MAG: hypothetical protein PHP08_03840 [Candidatus Dojkabacteria bacterium]|nr:hypothetical protein [Candidatus Dojkabacteria bacterium]
MKKVKTIKEVAQRFLASNQSARNPSETIRKGGAVPPTRVETPLPSPKPTKNKWQNQEI